MFDVLRPQRTARMGETNWVNSAKNRVNWSNEGSIIPSTLSD